MTQLGPEAIADVITACQANAGEISQAFTRTFDVNCDLSVGLGTAWDEHTHLEGLQGPGLAIVIETGTTALVAVLPESTGIIPAWYAESTPTGMSRLATLAQELSLLLIPDGISVGQSKAIRCESLSDFVVAAAPADAAARIPLVLHSGEQSRATLSVIWPMQSANQYRPAATSQTGAAKMAPPPTDTEGSEQLPSFTRSLLRVRVPVSVALATRKNSVQQILELGVGSIIHFDKPCDDPLELEVNGHCVAQGDAVKVGDKFGLRVQSVVLPTERFKTLRSGS